MERSVNLQLQHFRLLNDRALQLWLHASWDAFYQRCHSSSGQSWRFLSELQQSDREWFFVPMRGLKQGSAENPFLQHRSKSAGYHCEIEPSKIAQRLMAVRAQLASEWREELIVLASGHPHGSSHPDEQLLAGLATRYAFHELLEDLKSLPSQAPLHAFLSNYMLQHSMCMKPTGDAEGMLSKLAVQPIGIRGSSIVDPPQLALEVRSRRTQILANMAHTLESTEDENRSVRTSFLENCLRIE
uniref:Uncharacterized protein n=1 Tax=Calcidiscus leptoporus TaxID=127549 RepID=A0A7S0JC57_9EUKA